MSLTCTRTSEMDTISSLSWRCSLERRWWASSPSESVVLLWLCPICLAHSPNLQYSQPILLSVLIQYSACADSLGNFAVMLTLFNLLITAQIFFFFLGHKIQNFILCLHLLTSLHWLTDPFLLFFVVVSLFFCYFFQYLIPVCWPLPWTPPSSFAFALVFCNALAVGSRGNVTLWGTCGWWVVSGLWLAAFS